MHSTPAPPRPHPLRRRPWPWLLPVLTGAVGVLLGALLTLVGVVLSSPEASGTSSTTADAVRTCGLGHRDDVGFGASGQGPDLRMNWAAGADEAEEFDVARGDVVCVLERLGATSADVHRLLDSDRASASVVLERYQVTAHLDDESHQYADFQPTG
ncbi:hypothetical protein NBM05_10280 [Rothia sp. AR01]|uniref:Uncharacterized protein n=1 Tax=Rothia santali TaxID=2949643 RepID=A0A9X2HGN1_9MICC|nr:hypothetical protein [Rothia santali]MCP3426377.1 hypothetical protein [Rothia santali]